MQSGQAEYVLEVNGVNTQFKVSMREALLNRDWDVVTLQQVSLAANRYESYQPYLSELAAYVKKLVPKAQLAIHQTWAYEQDSPRVTERMGYARDTQMLEDAVGAYKAAAEAVGADYLIPCGEVFMAMLQNGVGKIHRDSYHATKGLGRYALGLTWYTVLTGRDIAENGYSDFDEAVSPEEMAIAKKCVAEVCGKYSK